MNNNNDNKFTGYIEGYYGKILSWKNRNRIITALSKNNMCFYLYAPKEDIKHRHKWRKLYKKEWLINFYAFTNFAKQNNIKVVAGISPGLDFNFNGFKKNNFDDNNDYFKLLKKSIQLLEHGSTNICLLLDDIPNDFNKNFGEETNEGEAHIQLANKLSHDLNKDIFFVPRIYARELIQDSPKYINSVCKYIKPNIKIFYCGNNVVSKSISNNDFEMFSNKINNDIIIWDNLYANDYCPKRLFLGPTLYRKNISNIMFNLTGLIETDLLLLEIITTTKNVTCPTNIWKDVLRNNDIPVKFIDLKDFFYHPAFNEDLYSPEIQATKKKIDAIDFLLWKWQAKIKLEWYPYLLNLKHDLQLCMKTFTPERIVKTQNNPVANLILKHKLNR